MAKPRRKSTQKVSINFEAGSTTAPYTEDVFSGEVKAKKGCEQSKYTLNGPSGGSTKSSSNGSWSISTNAPAGTYTATAKKKVIKKSRQDLVCKKGTSPTITVESVTRSIVFRNGRALRARPLRVTCVVRRSLG